MWPTGKGQSTIVAVWKKNILRSRDKFSGNCKLKKKEGCNKAGSEKNLELFLQIWPQWGRGNRLCSFMFAEGTMKTVNTRHSQFMLQDGVRCIFTVHCTQPREYLQCPSVEHFWKHTSRKTNGKHINTSFIVSVEWIYPEKKHRLRPMDAFVHNDLTTRYFQHRRHLTSMKKHFSHNLP
jgi:hypothetical protein